MRAVGRKITASETKVKYFQLKEQEHMSDITFYFFQLTLWELLECRNPY